MFIDYYQLLEISSTASQEEVVKAFRRQAMKWHPDRNKSPDASERMRLIIEAYQVLKNNEHRRRYDVELAEFNRQAKNFKAKDFYEKSFVNQRKHTTKQGAKDFANSYKFLTLREKNTITQSDGVFTLSTLFYISKSCFN